MHKRYLAFLDTETTGLDPAIHEIIEIGGVIVKQILTDGKVTFEVVDEFEYKVKPENIAQADKVALRVNGYDEADWVFAYTLTEAMTMLAEKTKDCIMVAHNAHFDLNFFDAAWKKTGIANPMHYYAIDTISVAFTKLQGKSEIEKLSLRALSEYFGLENKNAHTALSDARTTFELYKKLMLL
jgi:DNA polymerase III alpha subunit (gram-positive type)